MHWAVSIHTRPPSLSASATREDEGAMGAWPAGSADLRGGKKGDIFRLVREDTSWGSARARARARASARASSRLGLVLG